MVKFCIHCKADTFRYANGQCKPCKNAQQAAYRVANPDKLHARDSAWKKGNPEKVKAYGVLWRLLNNEKEIDRNRSWRLSNPEKHKASVAAWKESNKEKYKETQAAYRLLNRQKLKAKISVWRKLNQDKIKSASAIWHAKNPDSAKIISGNRRARKLKAGGCLSRDLSVKLFKLQKGKCPCCGNPLGENYHLDHRMPLALGGSNTDDNMQLLRSTCNQQKHAKHPIDFMQERGFLL